ncbi:MAG: polyprenyl synthetase family protein [Nitrospinae bacterium]|nr:polyprenyl synthetase family protein [Nitrospinota bacterium]
MTTSHFDRIRADVEEELHRIFDERPRVPQHLREAMMYSVFAGGKRLRPTLVVAAAEAVGGNRQAALPTAAAFEIIHTYTLIHDDLPAMDNDSLRRGLPTNHIKFGEATAILAGDGLLTLAFEVMAEIPSGASVDPAALVRVIRTVAQAVGSEGTVGGQQADMENEGKQADLKTLEYIHAHKTGTMITAAVEAGGLLGGASDGELLALTTYGKKIGLAFQVFDDILDVVGDAKTLGKNTGGDQKKKKTTYPALMGLEESKKFGYALVAEAVAALTPIKGDTEHLKFLAEYVAKRAN